MNQSYLNSSPPRNSESLNLRTNLKHLLTNLNNLSTVLKTTPHTSQRSKKTNSLDEDYNSDNDEGAAAGGDSGVSKTDINKASFAIQKGVISVCKSALKLRDTKEISNAVDSEIKVESPIQVPVSHLPTTTAKVSIGDTPIPYDLISLLPHYNINPELYSLELLSLTIHLHSGVRRRKYGLKRMGEVLRERFLEFESVKGGRGVKRKIEEGDEDEDESGGKRKKDEGDIDDEK